MIKYGEGTFLLGGYYRGDRMKKVNRIDQIGRPRFRIAVHALVWLAQKECVCSSKAIAERVNSHATFLRRVLATLMSAACSSISVWKKSWLSVSILLSTI